MINILLGLLFCLFVFGNSKSEDFPEIYGCFCEGGVILGKANHTDIVKIGKKKTKNF